MAPLHRNARPPDPGFRARRAPVPDLMFSTAYQSGRTSPPASGNSVSAIHMRAYRPGRSSCTGVDIYVPV